MRIIDEFELEKIKVSVFKMGERITVKFEYNLLEQSFKFRDGSGIENSQDVRLFCKPTLANKLFVNFEMMAAMRYNEMIYKANGPEEEFMEII
jgi:hypothetical protein